MKLEGIHHITAITAEAQRNVDFYAGLLGLRLVKKSVNQDQTSVYHLFYADEVGDAGSDITFFEYPGLPRGRAGAGMVHRIVWRVADTEALDFWQSRLTDAGHDPVRLDTALRFEDFEGLEHELEVVETSDEPLIAHHPEIPPELALQGFHAVRTYTIDPERSRNLLERTLGFERQPDGTSYEVRGERRGGYYFYDAAPDARALQGAGTVHHVAWSSPLEEHDAWQQRVTAAGAHATPVIDRYYFRSVYFREPSGVLFEIASLGPGFTVDEPVEQLGEKLSLTPQFEHLREQIEPTLTPLRNPRVSGTALHLIDPVDSA
jgi:glyoxalase family protein